MLFKTSHTLMGRYDGRTVFLYHLHPNFINHNINKISREKILDLKLMRDLFHYNLARFEGIYVTKDTINNDNPNILLSYVVMECGQKGVLQHVLHSTSIEFDLQFQLSLTNDISKV